MRLCDMWRSLRAVGLGLLLIVVTSGWIEAEEKETLTTLLPDGGSADLSLFQKLEWREAGPYRGGRSAAVAGIPDEPLVYYFGAAGGGVWKTTDAGVSWKNVSDGTFGCSIGAVTVSEWDNNVLYVGGGEKTLRGNVSHGDGVWKSTDAGRTWKFSGLSDSRHICRIRIHPKNPDLAYAAALGHLYGPNEERGVFRTKDGGKTWEKVLFVSNEAGAVDLILDPTNPRILYATFWNVLRTPYSLESGGDGSGIWKSTDAGDTWKELTGNEGLPQAPIGICGITVSPSNPDNLYAIVEADKGGVFRSRDAGKKWKRVNEDRSLRQRAWYYSRIYADPVDEDSLYVLNVGFHRSKDGGKSFERVSVPHSDNHDLWIDPKNPRRMIESNDGGANVTFDGGETWSRQDNQPTAQMYRLSVDDDFPYRLLGGQQDNSTVRLRSRSLLSSGIGLRDWEPTAGGESGHVVAKPGKPHIVFGGSYGGFLTRVNHLTGQRRSVNVWPDNPMGWGAKDLKYRFQWNFPIFFSPHDPDMIYAAGNVLFRSKDEGQSWEAISPDLTRNDKSKQESSGGPITKDNTSVEYYCTIFAALESPHEKGVLWAGSDDGLVHLSRDSGKTWVNVTPKNLPEWAQVNCIEVHPTVAGGLYLAATRYKSDDFEPYLYKTTDYGVSWRRVDRGIKRDHFTRAIRADKSRAGLLYAGTERGVYVSFDDGDNWQQFQQNLPEVPITDLMVKEKDLIAATQGRGYWILDDLTPIHQLSTKVASSRAHLFSPRESHRLPGRRSDRPGNQGMNPYFGVVIHYLLADEVGADTEFSLEVLDPQGRSIQTYLRKPDPDEEKDQDGASSSRDRELEKTKLLTAEKGLNRFVWNMRYPDAEGFPEMVLWNRSMQGPLAIPSGGYRARLSVGEWSDTVSFEILADPRSSSTAEDRKAQFAYGLAVRDKLTELHQHIRRIKDVRKQFSSLKSRLDEGDVGDAIREAMKKVDEEMKAVEEALYQTKNKSAQDPLNYPIRLNDKLSGLLRLASMGDSPPTEQMVDVKGVLEEQIDEQIDILSSTLATGLPEVNRLAKEAGIPAVVVKETESPGKP